MRTKIDLVLDDAWRELNSKRRKEKLGPVSDLTEVEEIEVLEIIRNDYKLALTANLLPNYRIFLICALMEELAEGKKKDLTTK